VKHILGFRVGSSENQEVCKDLLSNLQRRGLKASKDRKLLAVLDGSDALRNGVLELFPGTIIQRCLVHKERNIRGYLPRKDWKELADLFKRLRLSQGKKQAEEAKRSLELFLANKNAQARESLEEAGEELLALFELEVPNTLNISLLSTNVIENTFKNLRRHIGRVARWRKTTHQADLWLASGLTLAERGYRRIRGVDDLPKLMKALEKEKMEERKAA
jgi:transposase-like protein